MPDVRAVPQLPSRSFEYLSQLRTKEGLVVTCYAVALEHIPVDFFADPDGSWTYEALVEASGFSASSGVAIGALKQPFSGHLDGAAVVTLNTEARPYVAIIECPIAFQCVSVSEVQRATAA